MKPLTYEIVDSPAAALHKTAVLVVGPEETLLVDAGFTRSEGRRLAAAAKAAGRPLTTVFVSHGDPDFYFGLESVKEVFPAARVLAAASTVRHIEETYEEKLATWAGLGAELPTRLVRPEPLDGDAFEFEGHRFELRGTDFHLPDRHYLWEHRQRVLLGGVLLFQGLHVWTADTPEPAQRAAWIDLLDGMAALDPAVVIAGHRTPDAPTDLTAVDFTRDYLRAFETDIGSSPDPATATAHLRARYPEAGLLLAAELGTKAAMPVPPSTRPSTPIPQP
ncbi:MBL fold metallo-hydrolase [Kitasatospora sp. MMS16-BH015]|uniref:MBL fold metallo-hydrolase n=1 Tax=Kitasatospora sp. MMS16-BH015 TaxID=2018025 RepID=UPI000CA2BDDB|nr:MBL fold metallo-hydrolase [Kitasatospora sp. MMS16-BH015]AUG80393.1 MBL fold metallo-hydrolase [Kitasatospora sp. MMS16-BH015]